MLCENCEKNEATIVYKQIVHNQKTISHLCKACAETMGITNSVEQAPVSITGLLAKISPASQSSEVSDLKCSICGFSYEEFRKMGQLGCGGCYTAFASQLDELLKKIHSNNRHVGKSAPRGVGRPTDPVSSVLALREELKVAVKREEFEKAAELRDRIATLEAGRAD